MSRSGNSPRRYAAMSSRSRRLRSSGSSSRRVVILNLLSFPQPRQVGEALLGWRRASRWSLRCAPRALVLGVAEVNGFGLRLAREAGVEGDEPDHESRD